MTVNLLDKERIMYIQKPNKIQLKSRRYEAAIQKAAQMENRHLMATWLWQQKPATTVKGKKDQDQKGICTAWEKKNLCTNSKFDQPCKTSHAVGKLPAPLLFTVQVQYSTSGECT